tara:strand:- start:178 stop:480 length:303 start_codon:yes stop_codon:yes gene_type:complete
LGGLILPQKKWRSGAAKTLWARPIKRMEYPLLIKAMKEDGLHAEITEKGIVWYHGEYQVVKKHMRVMWGISQYQMKCFETHILETNPFGGYYEGNRYLDG